MIPYVTLGIAALSGMLLQNKQQRKKTDRSGAADLIFPEPGLPLRIEQIDERTWKSTGGASETQVRTSAIWRDSEGRLRIDSLYEENDTPPESDSMIIDPVSGIRVRIRHEEQIVYRMTGPKRGEAGFVRGQVGVGEGLGSEHKWNIRRENLGTRIIDGLEFEGTRVVQTAENDPALTNTIEQWYSPTMKLIGLTTGTGPYGTHTARIRNLHREDPDPTRFTIPTAYKIVDLSLE